MMRKSILLLSLLFHAPTFADNWIQVPKYFVGLSEETKVPADILYALAVKETNTKMSNRSVAPWPFTLNVKGKGYSYATYDEMVGAAYQFLDSGTRSIDIGLFQVNWLWNGHRASSIEDLGHPEKNGQVASEILLEHYLKHKDWAKAAGRYHNPANKNGRADAYEKEFRNILTMIQTGKYQKNLLKQHTTQQIATN